MVDIAFIILFTFAGNLIFKKLGLPGILGMIAAGFVLGPGYSILSIRKDLPF
jgi:Kef-type K+ transport system membrane component KefB